MLRKLLVAVLVLCTAIVSTGCSAAAMPMAAAEAAPLIIFINPEIGIVVMTIAGGEYLTQQTAESQTEALNNCASEGGQAVWLPTHEGPDIVTCDKSQLHVLKDGSPEHIKRRVESAKRVEGKSPHKCFKRGSARLLTFGVEPFQAGGKSTYSSIGFSYTSIERSSFIPQDKSVENFKLSGFTEEDQIDSPECRFALTQMQVVIDDLKQTSFWN